jgi:hypothetical protein
MRTVGFGVVVATAMFALPVNAQRIEIGPGGVRVGGGERGSREVCANCGEPASTRMS